MNKIKNHFKTHKELYIGIGVGAVAAIAGTCIFLLTTKKGSDIVQNTLVVGVKNQVNPTIVNFVERSTPSKPVHLVGTDLYFDSLNEAARKTGHPLSRISQNINGHISDIKGDVFEVLTKL